MCMLLSHLLPVTMGTQKMVEKFDLMIPLLCHNLLNMHGFSEDIVFKKNMASCAWKFTD